MVELSIGGFIPEPQTDPCATVSCPELCRLPAREAWTHSKSSLASGASAERRSRPPATADQGVYHMPTPTLPSPTASDPLPITVARAAGLDIHKMQVTASVRLCEPGDGPPRTDTAVFGTDPHLAVIHLAL